mgnify:CR=1 FL=1|tara:strand:- start:11116 stop:12114 length:999 start_codon:yes stop_codon:yes gene_type:complete
MANKAYGTTLKMGFTTDTLVNQQDITELTLPSISKDTIESAHYNSDGVKKYMGGLVDTGELTFTTLSRYPTVEDIFNNYGSNYNVVNTVDYSTKYPYKLIDINGDFEDTTYGTGIGNTGWTQSGSGGGLAIATDQPVHRLTFSTASDTNDPTQVFFSIPTTKDPDFASGHQNNSNRSGQHFLYTYKHDIESRSGNFNMKLLTHHNSGFKTMYTGTIGSSNFDNQYVCWYPYMTNTGSVTNGIPYRRIFLQVEPDNSDNGVLRTRNHQLRKIYSYKQLARNNEEIFVQFSTPEDTSEFRASGLVTNCETIFDKDDVLKETVTVKLTGGITKIN